MKCINPIIFKKIGKKVNSSGKVVDDLLFCGHLSSFKHTKLDKNFFDSKYFNFSNYIKIPCGRCINCRLNYAKHWADRLSILGENYEHKYFITLTYDNEHIEETKTSFVLDDGVVVSGYSLIKNHLQDFFKRLRSYAKYHNLVEKDIKYYACGEYGEKNSRCHYHLLLYGFKIPDLILEYRQNGFDYFQSDIIYNLWNKGRIQVNNISYESISYVARYCTKKQYGKNAVDYYLNKGVIPEFSVCSNGIGKEYFYKNVDKIYSSDSMSIERNGKIYKIKPFRYYDKLFDIMNPESMEYKKINRKCHFDSTLLHTDKYGIDYLQQLAVDNKLNKRKGV